AYPTTVGAIRGERGDRSCGDSARAAARLVRWLQRRRRAAFQRIHLQPRWARHGRVGLAKLPKPAPECPDGCRDWPRAQAELAPANAPSRESRAGAPTAATALPLPTRLGEPCFPRAL